MRKKSGLGCLLLLAMAILCGCATHTVDDMYTPPRRTAEYEQLQNAIDAAMGELQYCAPLTGENQQSVQRADLDGDGIEEYLLFARGVSEKPLQILIFGTEEERIVLWDRIECHGSGFEFVEYLDIDGQPGLELVFGCRMSEQVQRNLSVYSVSQSEIRQILGEKYYKFVGTDFDDDGCGELMLILPGETETDKASAVCYSMEDGNLVRSREVSLSAPADQIKRIMVGNLKDGERAVYVASALDEQAIITDVFAVEDGNFTNVSFSNESGTSVRTLRNDYVYADDIDGDGVLELPDLIPMRENAINLAGSRKYLIRWYAMDIHGQETVRMYTFHDLAAGWYLELDQKLVNQLSITEQSGHYVFSLWRGETLTELLRVDLLSGSNREEEAAEDGRIVMHRTDNVLYTARLSENAQQYGLTIDTISSCFHLVRQDWKTGETQ